MKTILDWMTHHYVAMVSIFLIAVALIVGIVGCGGESYILTIASTPGGSVTVPGEGTFTYQAGTLVNLVAEPEEGCLFVNWTGNVGTITNVHVASTMITVNDSYSITANFEPNPGWYSLTISSSLGGVVTEPGEGIHVYVPNTTVQLVAQPDLICHFLRWTSWTDTARTCSLQWTGDADGIADANNATTNITMNNNYTIRANFQPPIGAGFRQTAGLNSDGTVVAVGDNDHGQCDVGNWTDIIQVAADWWHTVGLKFDGTAVAVGWNDYGQCDVNNWTGIVQVSAGSSGHTVGLKSDGTVVAVGYNWPGGPCDVGGWTDIIWICAGGYHTVGVRSDGTVVAVGDNDFGQCNVSGWDLN